MPRRRPKAIGVMQTVNENPKPKAAQLDPIVLDLLNAEAASQRGDLSGAQMLLEQVLSSHASNVRAQQRPSQRCRWSRGILQAILCHQVESRPWRAINTSSGNMEATWN